MSQLGDNLSRVLAGLIEPFRFIKHARERQMQARREEREYLLEMIETVMSRQVEIQTKQTEAAIAQAESMAKTAEALMSWFDMFRHANKDMEHVGTATVRPEDEYEAERLRERERLKAKGYPVDASPAEQLQWLLENEELGS